MCSSLLNRVFILTLKSHMSNTIHTTIFKTIEFMDSHHLITPKKKKLVLDKRKVLHLQHFYNIFTTNHRWLVVISSNLNITLKLNFYPNNNN